MKFSLKSHGHHRNTQALVSYIYLFTIYVHFKERSLSVSLRLPQFMVEKTVIAVCTKKVLTQLARKTNFKMFSYLSKQDLCSFPLAQINVY